MRKCQISYQDSQEEEHLYEYVDAFAEALSKLGEH